MTTNPTGKSEEKKSDCAVNCPCDCHDQEIPTTQDWEKEFDKRFEGDIIEDGDNPACITYPGADLSSLDCFLENIKDFIREELARAQSEKEEQEEYPLLKKCHQCGNINKASEKCTYCAGQFIECDTCRAKPGKPPLCNGCISNRDTICRLGRLLAESQSEKEKAFADGMKLGREYAVDEFTALLEGMGMKEGTEEARGFNSAVKTIMEHLSLTNQDKDEEA